MVIWDTTIQKATTDETLVIVGHELGHYVLGHVWKGFLFAAVLLLIGYYASVSRAALDARPLGWGVENLRTLGLGFLCRACCSWWRLECFWRHRW